jgi:hypothetical protein
MVWSSWYNTKVPLFYDGDFSGQKWIPNDGTASRSPSSRRDTENNNTVCIGHIYFYIYKYNIQSLPDDRQESLKNSGRLEVLLVGSILTSIFDPEDECSILFCSTGVTRLDGVINQMTIIHIPHLTVPNK